MANKIAPVTIWSNGQSKVAEYLQVFGNNVKLGVSASFYYALYTKVVDADGEEILGEQLTQGTLYLNGEEYQLWNEDTYAWAWVASQLNLTIL
jgi:hypothetical protein